MIKHFRTGVIWRVCLLAASLLLLSYLAVQTTYYVTIALLGIVIVMQVIQLIRYVERTNRKLTKFLNSIRYSDFSRSFIDRGLGESFELLNQAFSRVIEEFKKERVEKQEHFRYLQTVVQHIGIGLISFNQKGEVELINTAAKRLFDVPALRNIEALGSISKTLLQKIRTLKSGERTLVQIRVKNTTLQLAISATEFKMRDDMYKLVSFQNIHSELEEKEMEAWQNLTQVLAHEIMNSITPIASLSDTVHMLLQQKAISQNGEYNIDRESLQDVKEALDTIKNRSHGLMKFVNSYRDFTQIPEPSFEIFKVEKLLKRVKNLNKGEAETQNVSIDISVDPKTLEITADRHLIEQVMINLTKNAFRALENTSDPKIRLNGFLDTDGRSVIQIHDNGEGIKEENLEKIFIPFFSTGQPTKRSGSGIGLSLSRQIMRKHNGTLTVSSDENGTTFSLRF